MPSPVEIDAPRVPVDITDSALYYAEQGLRIFPCHYPTFDDDGTLRGCSCKDPACQKPGKHPAIADWPNQATADPDRVRAYWRRRPFSNIGLLCGEANGFDVLDVDPKDDGPANLAAITTAHGPLPATLTSHTGSGGQHLLFRHANGLKNNNHGKIARGLDFRTTGGQIIAPPSLHFSGNRYLWENSEPIAPPPPWLVERMRADPTHPSQRERVPLENWREMALGPPTGARHNVLTQIAGILIGGYPIKSKHLAITLVHAYNQFACDPPKSKEEVDKIIEHILKKQIKRLG